MRLNLLFPLGDVVEVHVKRVDYTLKLADSLTACCWTPSSLHVRLRVAAYLLEDVPKEIVFTEKSLVYFFGSIVTRAAT